MKIHTLSCKDIVYRRGQRLILDSVGLSVTSGELISLLGVNGAGKSTLLRILLGLLKPQSGSIELDHKPFEAWQRSQIAKLVAYVPQVHVATFPYNVREVVALGRMPHTGLGRKLSTTDNEVISASLERLAVSDLANRPYTELSGGERQRVLLARALAQQTPLLVMDEPLTGLDLGHQTRMLMFLSEIAAEGYGILTTTHRPEDALQVATRAVLLDHGHVIADGPPRSILDVHSISALYNVPMEQLDLGIHRFFVPQKPHND